MGNNFSSRVVGSGAGGKEKALEILNIYFQKIVFDRWLAAYKLFKVIKGVHSEKRHVVCKIFAFRDLMEAQVFSELIRLLKKIKRIFSDEYSKNVNIIPYQEVLMSGFLDDHNSSGRTAADRNVGLTGNLVGGSADVAGNFSGVGADAAGRSQNVRGVNTTATDSVASKVVYLIFFFLGFCIFWY